MPIVDMQIRMRELGRIRTGNQVAVGDGRKRPAKLETFRLTSASESLMAAAAELYGGKVVPWDSPSGKQFEVITTTDVLSIVIPPGQALSQWYELWTGGGCQRRCDGLVETLSDQPCLCPSDSTERREQAAAGNACKPTTRLNVLLPDLPDLGLFRLESHGYYAAVELAGAAQFLSMASAAGMNIPARLRLEQREKKVPGQPTNRYSVPVIEFTTTRIVDLLNAGAGPMMLGDAASQITGPAPAQLAPGSLTPPKGQRARQPKVDRPTMGPPPAVPDGSDFGRRQPVTATAAPPPLDDADEPVAEPEAEPVAAAAPVAPDTVAGWTVVDEPPAPPAPKAPRVKKSKEPPPKPLTAAQLKELVQGGTVSLEFAGQVFKRRFPTVRNLAELNDEERGRYWHEVVTTAAQQASPA